MGKGAEEEIVMDRILIALRLWLARMATRDAPPDPLADLSLREWADLPSHHDRGCPQ
jgi:hypothetical protein